MGVVVNATLHLWEWLGTPFVGGWVGPRASLNGCKNSCPLLVFNPQTVQPIVSRNTNYTILVHHFHDIPQQNLFCVGFDISTVQKSPGQWKCGSWGSVFYFWFCYVLFWWIYCHVKLWVIWSTWSSSERRTWHSETIVSKTLHWLRQVAGLRNITL